MEKRRIAGGISVSRIGIGCWSFGGGAYWGPQSQKDVETVVHRALDGGINFFDTARMYNDGDSERSLGAALKNRRDRAVICSKVSPAKAYYDTLRAECDRSLAGIGTDYIDIYMLHWPINHMSVKHFTSDPAVIANPPTPAEAFAALSDLKKEGKIRAIGVSNFGVKQMTEAISLCPDMCVNEITYNIISRAIETEIMPFCVNHGIALITSMTLMQGILAGSYKTAEEIPPHQAHSRHFKNERGRGTSRHREEGAEEEIFNVLRILRDISAQLGITPAQLSAAWVLANKNVDCALVGSRSEYQLAQNMASASVILPDEITEQINAVSLPALKKLGSSADYYENSAGSRIY
ncbi:MAG: aldo/keto reductase [Eubacteriales bacterium]|nr:aldo/keto reductase [Eubacteriales bacterium]